MLLTSEQHRAIAAFLWRKAANESKDRRLRCLKRAELHAALARAQEINPSLAPRPARSIEEAYEIAATHSSAHPR